MQKCYIISAIFLLAVSLSCDRTRPGNARERTVSEVDLYKDSPDTLDPLSVGNGTMYFSFDATGMQTFPGNYSRDFPLEILLKAGGQCISAGLIGLEIKGADHGKMMLSDIKDIAQKLSISTGLAESRFVINNIPVCVKTVCHPLYNMISFKFNSGLIKEKRLMINISIPGGNPRKTKNKASVLNADSNNVAIITVNSGEVPYRILIWKNNADLRYHSPDNISLDPPSNDTVYSFSCQFLLKDSAGRIQTFGETEMASKKMWREYWADMSSVPPAERGIDKSHLMIQQYLKKIKICERAE